MKRVNMHFLHACRRMVCFPAVSNFTTIGENSMDTRFQTTFGSASEVAVTRHRVLRNTYWLLAISMIPTVLGAWLGVRMNFSLFTGSPMLGFVLFLAIAFGFMYAIEKTKHSAAGIAVLLGFTFFMGLIL